MTNYLNQVNEELNKLTELYKQLHDKKYELITLQHEFNINKNTIETDIKKIELVIDSLLLLKIDPPATEVKPAAKKTRTKKADEVKNDSKNNTDDNNTNSSDNNNSVVTAGNTNSTSISNGNTSGGVNNSNSNIPAGGQPRQEGQVDNTTADNFIVDNDDEEARKAENIAKLKGSLIHKINQVLEPIQDPTLRKDTIVKLRAKVETYGCEKVTDIKNEKDLIALLKWLDEGNLYDSTK